MKKACVYKITSPDNKVYIGSTTNIEKRLNFYRKLNCKKQSRIYLSMIEHGFDNHIFEILCECDQTEMMEKEAYYGHLLNALCPDKGLNCVLPKGSENRVSMCRETRDKISKSTKGVPKSEEAIKNMSECKKGFKFSLESRQKMSKSHIGYKHSEESKAKISLAGMGRTHPNSGRKTGDLYGVRVIDKNSGIIYNSFRAGAEACNLSRSCFTNMVQGKIKNKTSFEILNKQL